jgi:hypothetical protein
LTVAARRTPSGRGMMKRTGCRRVPATSGLQVPTRPNLRNSSTSLPTTPLATIFHQTIHKSVISSKENKVRDLLLGLIGHCTLVEEIRQQIVSAPPCLYTKGLRSPSSDPPEPPQFINVTSNNSPCHHCLTVAARRTPSGRGMMKRTGCRRVPAKGERSLYQ